MMIEQQTKRKFPFVFLLKIAVLIGLLLVVFYVEDIEQRKILAQLIKGLSSFLIPSIILSIIRFIIIAVFHARHAKQAVRGNFVLGVNRLTAMLNVVFMIIGVMIASGINPLEFLTSLTIVAMAIAVLFREYITNMLSGLFIMFSEQLSVGDRIKIGEHKGRIVDITFANIEIQNEEDDIVMIPNNLVFTMPMVNLSAHRSNLFTVRFELPLITATDTERLEKEIQNVLRNHPNLDAEAEINLEIVEIGKDLVKYKVELHAVSSSNRLHKKLENELLRHILFFEKGYLKSS